MAVLLALLAFAAASGLRYAFGSGEPEWRISIDHTPGTPFFKIERIPRNPKP